MVVMQVAGLTLDEETKAPMLVLKNVQGDETLTIWIGAMEAMAISVMLNAVSIPRPLTHDLLLNALHVVGGEVLGVIITALNEGTYFAELDLISGGTRHRVDCRPSDAVALALRAQVPIMVHQAVLDAATRAAEPDIPGDPEKVAEPADATAEMMRRAEALRSGLSTAEDSGDAESADEKPDEETLADLLRHLEPDTKTKM